MIVPLVLFGSRTIDPSAASRAAMQAALGSSLNGSVTPALSVAVSARGRIVFVGGIGDGLLSNFQERRFSAPKPDTLFRLASISKPMTALMIMRLVEDRRVGLDDDIRKYVPSFPDKGGTITIRQVLSHTSGIRHYEDGKRDGGHFDRCEEALAVWAGDPLLFAPGERFSYSTHAYTLLGAILENATGSRYDELLGRFVRQPSGTTSPRVENRSRDRRRHATLLEMRKDAYVLAEPDDLSWKTSGGGLEATPTDLCKVGDALIGGRIISLQTLLTMTNPVQPRTGRSSYGLGVAVGDGFFGHTGSQLGGQSFWRVYPRQAVVVTVMSNSQRRPVDDLGVKIGAIWTQTR